MPFTTAATMTGIATTSTMVVADVAVMAMATGAVVQAYGAREQTKSQAAMYEYNERVRQQQAAQQRRASLEEQHIQRDRMKTELKRRRALYAKGKIRMEGTPFETQLEAAEEMATEIAFMAESRSIQAGRYASAAGLESYKAKATRRAGRIGVATALFGGVSDISKLGIKYAMMS